MAYFWAPSGHDASLVDQESLTPRNLFQQPWLQGRTRDNHQSTLLQVPRDIH